MKLQVFDNQFKNDVNRRSKTTEDCVFYLLVTNHHWVKNNIWYKEELLAQY